MDSSETEKINSNERAARCGGWQPAPGMKADVEILQPVGDWSLRSFRDEAEIYAISSALKKTGWNRKRAAQLLLISYRGLLYKIREHNITPESIAQLKPLSPEGNGGTRPLFSGVR
jgi:DNA-binding NtrC family response regulator